MALTLKTLPQFPLFHPPPPNHHRTTTVIRFSHWNNANAQKFNRYKLSQKQIEDQIRIQKRFQSAQKLANLRPIAAAPPPFKSAGTPSTPSRRSIPGKKSKYSKPIQNPDSNEAKTVTETETGVYFNSNYNSNSNNNFNTHTACKSIVATNKLNSNNNFSTHPAFKKVVRIRNLPKEEAGTETQAGIKYGETGVTYVIPDAPFEFQYSYTETPKVKPVKLREPPVAPFGPGTMPRPWTGKKPLPASKKKKVEFDSFTLPPPHKKGVKPVQAPGPFLAGAGPRYVREREEVLGEELTKEEVDTLVKGCLKSSRQLNMGRDGLTHNMLDNIQAHWKRRRVCKIKCKGVCTVDMDNVRQQLEEKTGGKVIYSKGGVVYLFRGRNYNYKTRPVYPLMLWKPVTPVYPRLIQRVPEGLTLEEASEMRKKGRELIPICKLGKNGVYCDLVNNVREAFEACDLVRINCEGMNGSDYRKIGAKLKDLVPCVLISFEHEHILVWRGQNWKSMFTEDDKPQESKNPETKLDQTEVIIPTFDNIDDTKIITPVASDDNKITSHVDIDDNQSETTSKQDSDIVDNKSETTSKQDSLTGVMSLLKQAVQDGIAFVLEDSHLDADMVYAKAVTFSKTAQPGPTFRLQRAKKVVTEATEKQEDDETVVNEVVTVSVQKKGGKNTSPRTRKKDKKENYLDVVPQSTLRVDELAKLLG